jgi:hypothetical protein
MLDEKIFFQDTVSIALLIRSVTHETSEVNAYITSFL